MSKSLKRILLKLAKLPRADQQWVLKQLSPQHQELFKNMQGDSLLNTALMFRNLPIPQSSSIVKTISLPECCTTLAQSEPFYVAIILEQGQFSWETAFLERYEHKAQLTASLYLQMSELKPATKQSVFQQWQNQLSFNDQLEISHG